MDLATALTYVTSLTPERKKQLLEKHAADTLSEEEKEELGRHLITAKLELENEGVVQRLLR